MTAPPSPAGDGLVVAAGCDAAALARLHRTAFAAGWSAADMAGLLSLQTTTGLMHGTGEDLHAFILLSQVADEAEILTLAVDPRHRRKGIGRRLVSAAAAIAAAGGARRLLLEVGEGNSPARALYGAVGFRQVGRRAAYYPNGEKSEDALVLELVLPVAPD